MGESDLQTLTLREQMVRMRTEIKYLSDSIKKLEEQSLKRIEDNVTAALKDHDQRLRVLENFRWWIIGALFASGLVSAALGKLLAKM